MRIRPLLASILLTITTPLVAADPPVYEEHLDLSYRLSDGGERIPITPPQTGNSARPSLPICRV